MDKFGIFKLITSLFDFYKQNKSENDFNSGANPSEDSSKTTETQHDESAPNLKNEKPLNVSGKKPDYSSQPLKTQMLKTITSHNELLKRVNAKNDNNALIKK